MYIISDMSNRSRDEFTAYVHVYIYGCTAIHNHSSSGSLFFATLRQNN